MKKNGDIFQQMGFRDQSSETVKEAFLNHLIKDATGVAVSTPSERRPKKATVSRSKQAASKAKENQKPVQLTFDFYQDLSHKKDRAS